MAELNWSAKSFEGLGAGDLYRILKLREEVFILEQECLYQDLDDKDQASVHVMGSDSITNALAAYARVVPPGLTFAEPSIGRVVTAPQYRGLQLGKDLMRRAIQVASEQYHGSPIRISAQAHLQRFYREFGFVSVGDIYLEDGIDHIAMLLQPMTTAHFLDIHTHRQTTDSFEIYNLSAQELEEIAGEIAPGTIDAHSRRMYSAGIHPWDVHPDKIDQQLQQLKKVASLSQVGLIGECGLDKRRGPDLQKQIPAFIEQANLAVNTKKPIIIHCVKAFDELIRIQQEHRFDTSLIIHGFNKSPEMARQLTEHGFFLSFGTALLRKKELADTLTFLHRGTIPFFLETDNSPVSIGEIYAHAAILLKISMNELKDVIFASWKKIGLKHG